MAKAGDLFKKILMKGNVYRSDLSDLIKTLNETDVEFPSDVETAIKSLDTEANFKDSLGGELEYAAKKAAMNTARVEVYDKMDKVIKNFTELLPDDKKAEYDKFGDKSTAERTKFILDHLQERSTESANASGDAKTFKGQLEKLQKEMADDYVPKTELAEASKNLGDYKQKLYNKEILTSALFHGDVADSVKKERWFNPQFLSDTNELLTNKGWEVDSDSGKIREKGKETFLLREGTTDAMNVDDLVSQVVSKYSDYQKRSDGSAPDGQITTGAGEQTGAISSAQQRQIESRAAYASQ